MSQHRRIAPSNTNSHRPNLAHASSSGNEGSNEATSGGSTEISGSASSSKGRDMSGDSSATTDPPRKRRAPGPVTAMACSECRRARQKCDGMAPKTCTRCQTRNLECRYEPHTKTHKETLLLEIANLRRDNTRLQTLNEEVSSAADDLQQRNQGLLDSQEWQQIILDEIGRNGHDREIIRKLRRGQSSESIAIWLTQQQPISRSLEIVPPEDRSLLDIVAAFEQHYREEAGIGHEKQQDIPRTDWTSVTSSPTLLGHLFDLYFTWVHPVHMLFSELDFRRSFESSDETYCSSALVNAICAMACHLIDGDEEYVKDLDVDALATGFMNQARHEVRPQDYTRLTSVQALAIMYLADLSAGRARSATGYLRAAVEFLRAANLDGQSSEARELSSWGIQTLNTCVLEIRRALASKLIRECRSSTGITYQKLYAPEVPQMVRFVHVNVDSDNEVWRFYRTVGEQRDLHVRPSYAILTACHQVALFRIIHESLNIYCGLRGMATAEIVLTLYRRYLDWEEDLPPVLQSPDESAQPLPHVLYLHAQYHVAVVQHLTPLLQNDFFHGPWLHEIRRIVVDHAARGARIIDRSRQLYSTRYLMPLICFCIVHIGDTLIRYSPQDPLASEVVRFCLETLQEASPGFPLCGPLQELFRRTAVECGTKLPSNIDQLTGGLGNYGVDDILDACTRLDYKQPVDQSMRHVDENIEEDWPYKWQQIVESLARPEPPPSTRQMSLSEKQIPIDSLLNR
ncbi:MAG: hypothetical protein Q9222_007747 [Ikaeria aurantiellina]